MGEKRTLTRGDIVTDRESNEEPELLVVEVTSKNIDEVVIGWDWNKNERTVADANEDSEFYEDYKDNNVIKVVYLDSLSDRHPNVSKTDLDKIDNLIDQSKMKVFSFPRNRLVFKK